MKFKFKKAFCPEHIRQVRCKLCRMGFTLIELLVVVAIIGILSTVVVVSVSGAQSKAKDAKIKSDLAQISKAAERYAITSGNYYQNLNCTNSTACEAFSSDPNPDKKAIGELAMDIKSVNSEGLVIVAANKSYLASTHLLSAPSPQPAVTVSTIAGSEMVVNPGFETVSPPANFANWNEYAGTGTIVDESTLSHTGVHSLKLTSGSGANTYAYQGLTLTAGATYSYSFWARGDGTNDGRIYIEYKNIGSSWVRILDYTHIGISGTTYAIVSGYFAVPLDANTGSNTAFHLIGSSSNGGIVYFDDISIKQF